MSDRYVYLVNHDEKALYTIPVVEENGIEGIMNAMKVFWDTFIISGWRDDNMSDIKVYKDTECSLEEYNDYRIIKEMISSHEHYQREQRIKNPSLPPWKSYEEHLQRKRRKHESNDENEIKCIDLELNDLQ